MLEQIFVATVRFLRRSKAGKLAHGEKLAAVASGMDAASKWSLSGMAEMLIVVPFFGQVGLSIKTPDRHAGDGRKTCVPVLIEIGARGGSDWPLGSFLERRP